MAQPVEPSLQSEDDATRHHGHTKLESYEPEYPHMMEAELPWQPSNDDATHGDIIDSGDDCVNFLASLDISDEANVCFPFHLVIPLPHDLDLVASPTCV